MPFCSSRSLRYPCSHVIERRARVKAGLLSCVSGFILVGFTDGAGRSAAEVALLQQERALLEEDLRITEERIQRLESLKTALPPSHPLLQPLDVDLDALRDPDVSYLPSDIPEDWLFPRIDFEDAAESKNGIVARHVLPVAKSASSSRVSHVVLTVGTAGDDPDAMTASTSASETFEWAVHSVEGELLFKKRDAVLFAGERRGSGEEVETTGETGGASESAQVLRVVAPVDFGEYLTTETVRDVLAARSGGAVLATRSGETGFLLHDGSRFEIYGMRVLPNRIAHKSVTSQTSAQSAYFGRPRLLVEAVVRDRAVESNSTTSTAGPLLDRRFLVQGATPFPQVLNGVDNVVWRGDRLYLTEAIGGFAVLHVNGTLLFHNNKTCTRGGLPRISPASVHRARALVTCPRENRIFVYTAALRSLQDVTPVALSARLADTAAVLDFSAGRPLRILAAYTDMLLSYTLTSGGSNIVWTLSVKGLADLSLVRRFVLAQKKAEKKLLLLNMTEEEHAPSLVWTKRNVGKYALAKGEQAEDQHVLLLTRWGGGVAVGEEGGGTDEISEIVFPDDMMQDARDDASLWDAGLFGTVQQLER
eukprot:g11021.t1